VPETVPRLTAAGYEVLVEAGAGADAWYSDSTYADAGATVVTDLTGADVVLSVSQPDPRRLTAGQTVIGMLSPLTDRAYVAALASLGVTPVSLDGLPRTLSRAQAMDALSSQASVAGYKAVLIGASAYGGFFPLMITAAGTARPARVLVLGTGVAGLQAIGTARRLGALVTGYDVRPASRGEVESLGATFLELSVSAAGEGGYARELTPEERQAQQEELAGHIASHDVLITTAQVPGRRPPLLVTEDAVKGMRAGSVAVDMGASVLGGNVFGSSPGETLVTDNGVMIIGATNLPSSMPVAASNAYSRNIAALLLHMTREGSLVIDLSDEIQAGVVVRDAGD
jgi:NAD(P) transhydrogenase subunit alpha